MQLLVNGLVAGMEISLLALAFQLVYLPTGVFHIALGGIYVIASYIAWSVGQTGAGMITGVAAALLAGGVLNMACEVINHRPLNRKGCQPGAHFVSSLGLYIVMTQAVALIWGNEPKFMTAGSGTSFSLLGITLSLTQAAKVAVSCAGIASFYVWLSWTGTGLRLRGLAENPAELALRGHHVGRLRLTTFAISGFLAAAGGLASSFDVGFDPHGGLNTLLGVAIAVMIGGRESFLGPLVGGLVLGLARSLTVWVFSSSWQETVVFILLAVVLYALPNGLLGYRLRGEV